MKKVLCILLLQAMLAAITGCSSIEDDRIPPAPVSLTFRTVADWDMYANPAALEYKMFIKEQRIPSNFNYTAISETGLGGIFFIVQGIMLNNAPLYITNIVTSASSAIVFGIKMYNDHFKKKDK